jgi:hypothetical protein
MNQAYLIKLLILTLTALILLGCTQEVNPPPQAGTPVRLLNQIFNRDDKNNHSVSFFV